MPDKSVEKQATARQIELAVRGIDRLAPLWSTTTKIIGNLASRGSQRKKLIDVIESDPALVCLSLYAANQENINLAEKNFSIRHAIEAMPTRIINDALFSLEPYQAESSDLQVWREQLVLHCIGVGLCAERIAELTTDEISPQLAYLCGLLHDIGKLALQQVMPRSFERIVSEAESRQADFCKIEQEYLGVDHTVLGKRLAEKWRIPNALTMGIWLHHSDTEMLTRAMASARIAQIVQIADWITRQFSIGQSGSYGPVNLTDEKLESFGLTPARVKQIGEQVIALAAQRAELLGFNGYSEEQVCESTFHLAISNLAKDNIQLTDENNKLKTEADFSKFTGDFISRIKCGAEGIEIAEEFAHLWQEHFQTGSVCIYLNSPADLGLIETALVTGLGERKKLVLQSQPDFLKKTGQIRNNTKVLPASEVCGGLFEELDVEFDASRSQLVPLVNNEKVFGGIVFELHYPDDAKLFQEQYKAAASIAATVFSTALIRQEQQNQIEQMVRLFTNTEETPSKSDSRPSITPKKIKAENNKQWDSLTALAEMAAGAAHELNNPLSVISGRAQLLAEKETDPEKRNMLEQVRENTTEIAQIVDDLMSFARPSEPWPSASELRQIIEEALQLAAQRLNVQAINSQVDVAATANEVFTDSGQVASAIANIICNSLESYTGLLGPVKIEAKAVESGDAVLLEISDAGRGMDTEILRKATYPFFSAKPAGRKRGMGLAYATRLIEINNGSLNIKSEPLSGTTVSIKLPCK